jgi:hypothetical protein
VSSRFKEEATMRKIPFFLLLPAFVVLSVPAAGQAGAANHPRIGRNDGAAGPRQKPATGFGTGQLRASRLDSLRDVPIQWPDTVRVGPDQAVLNGDQLYTTGDRIVFTFAPPSALLANGRVWAVCVSPVQPPAPPGTAGAWVQELYERYVSSTKPTNGEKIRDAYSKMDHSHIDPSKPPRIGDNDLFVQFVDWDEEEAMVEMTPPPTPQEIEDRARMKVRTVLAGIQSDSPFVFINSAGRNGGFMGASATALLPVLCRAKAGLATDSDLKVAAEHSVSGVVRLLQERVEH